MEVLLCICLETSASSYLAVTCTVSSQHIYHFTGGYFLPSLIGEVQDALKLLREERDKGTQEHHGSEKTQQLPDGSMLCKSASLMVTNILYNSLKDKLLDDIIGIMMKL